METQIFSALERHNSYFKAFIGLLVDKFHPLQIFCFSKRHIFSGLEGIFTNSSIDFKVHYCLLMVTETNTRIDHEAQDYANSMYEDGKITLLCHGQLSISEAIQQNNRFFTTVYSSGELLYNLGGINILNLTKNYKFDDAPAKARKHYNHRISLAEAFLMGAKECLIKEQYNVCAFLLHQVVEQCCIGVIRVHLAYRSEFHNLKRLLTLCIAFSCAPYNVFITGEADNDRLFEILVKSYSQARYGNNFIVAKEDADKLFRKISSFVILISQMCERKIAELESEVVYE